MARKRTPYDDIFRAASRKFGIPYEVLAGQDQVESGFNVNAQSPAGAFGVSQFIPSTAKSYGVKRGDPQSQIFGQAHYLSDLGYAKDPNLALSKYNAGPGNPGAAGDYAQKVLAAAKRYAGLGGSQLQPSPLRGASNEGTSSPATGPNLFTTLGSIGQSAGLYDENDTMAQNWRLMGIIQDLNSKRDVPIGQDSDTTPAVPLRGGARDIATRAGQIDREKLPYSWGGGHGASPAKQGVPLDCSGAVSRALGINPRVSGDFQRWGASGKGHMVTIYANPEHVLMEINGHFWGTSKTNPGGGAGWIPRSAISPQYLKRFTARHPPGM